MLESTPVYATISSFLDSDAGVDTASIAPARRRGPRESAKMNTAMHEIDRLLSACKAAFDASAHAVAQALAGAAAATLDEHEVASIEHVRTMRSDG